MARPISMVSIEDSLQQEVKRWSQKPSNLTNDNNIKTLIVQAYVDYLQLLVKDQQIDKMNTKRSTMLDSKSDNILTPILVDFCTEHHFLSQNNDNNSLEQKTQIYNYLQFIEGLDELQKVEHLTEIVEKLKKPEDFIEYLSEVSKEHATAQKSKPKPR